MSLCCPSCFLTIQYKIILSIDILCAIFLIHAPVVCASVFQWRTSLVFACSTARLINLGNRYLSPVEIYCCRRTPELNSDCIQSLHAVRECCTVSVQACSFLWNRSFYSTGAVSHSCVFRPKFKGRQKRLLCRLCSCRRGICWPLTLHLWISAAFNKD